MRKSKFVTKILTLALLIALSSSMLVNASAAVSSSEEESTSELNNEMQTFTEEIEPEDISSLEAKVTDRDYTGGEFSISDATIAALSDEEANVDALYSTEANVDALYGTEANEADVSSDEVETSSNTDPNNAYIVTNDTIVQETIGTNGEMRWYAFVLNEKSKVTINLQMVEALDADLYMYSLNTETYQLELVGGSATEGVGVTEYYNNTLETGTYFFAVGGYEGTGNFAFAYYQSSSDVTNEVNDSVTSATNVTFNSSISGVIDNPNDVDYYKITVTSPTIIQYSFSTTDNYSLLYAEKTGTSAGISYVNSSKNSYKIMPGSYYFAVISENGNYSSTSTYSVTFKKVGTMTTDSAVTQVGISEEAGIVYQTNSAGTVNYINGNPIDISYSYYKNLSNSAGSQVYDISIDANAGAFALQSDVYEPAAVYYLNSTRPAMDVKNQSALLLTFYSDSKFYKIHCMGTGSYSMNTLRQDLNYVTVLIDPATGKLIDIADFNYFYDFAPVGTNSITWTRSYNMSFYNN